MSAKILYVEDNPHNMNLIRRILEQQGFEVVGAINAESGITMATEEQPDLILMDIDLPDMDGLEATSNIKSNPNLSRIPIIALTAYANYGDEERALAAGCDGYLAKPVSRVRLTKQVMQYLNIEAE